MDEQTRLLTLAHLKNGSKPADAAELTGISYASALKLKKELHAAEERNSILQLFKLDKASLEILLDGVKKQLIPAIEAFDMEEEVNGEVQKLTNGIDGGKLLNQEFQDSASAIANKITITAMAANNAETILLLSKALCELQRAFFGGDSAPASGLPISSFEQHLKN
jgi:hypothetical protein